MRFHRTRKAHVARGETPARKKRGSYKRQRLDLTRKLPDMDLIGKQYGIWHVICKRRSGKGYDAGFDAWNKKHGFMCALCGREQPMDAPDHVVKHVARKT